MRNQRKIVMALAISVTAVAVAGCTGVCRESFHQLYDETQARYSEMHANKALYVNLDDYCLNWVGGLPTPQAASAAARAQCEANAATRGVNPARCTLVAINAKQFWMASAAQLGTIVR